MRILFVKLGSIGDIVHTLPALSAVRRALPNAQISWVVERRSSAILRDNPVINHLIEVDTKALRRWPASGETLLAPRQQFRRLRASSFDIAIDFQGLLKSAAIARFSSSTKIIGFDRKALREPASRLLLSRTVRVRTDTHVIEKNLALVAGALGISVPSRGTDFEFPLGLSSSDELEADKLVELSGTQFAVLNPGGGWPTKQWSPARFGELADKLWEQHGLTSIISYGPDEEGLANEATKSSRSGRAFAASPSLKGFLALAKRARLYVGGDTGPTHLAVAAATPVVGLFGPTEWWRNGSPNPDDICVERLDIGCRVSCHRRACSNWICMEISVEDVLAAATERLERAKAKEGDLTPVGT
jgi:lipopolysaccharide heptosyltransferase I